jgi:hypothetical protein
LSLTIGCGVGIGGDGITMSTTRRLNVAGVWRWNSHQFFGRMVAVEIRA